MYIARPELGTKRLCVRCAVRFYDLQRVPAHCPACAMDQPPPAPRSRAVPRPASPRWQARPAARDAVVEVAAEDEAVPLLEVADDDEDEAEVAGIDADGEDAAERDDEAG